MRNVTAILKKQWKDTLKNKNVLIQFVMFPVLDVCRGDAGLAEKLFCLYVCVHVYWNGAAYCYDGGSGRRKGKTYIKGAADGKCQNASVSGGSGRVRPAGVSGRHGVLRFDGWTWHF